MSIEEAGERRLADEKKVRVRALANRHGEVTQGKARQQQSLDQAHGRLGELKEQLAGRANTEVPLSLKNAISVAAPC